MGISLCNNGGGWVNFITDFGSIVVKESSPSLLGLVLHILDTINEECIIFTVTISIQTVSLYMHKQQEQGENQIWILNKESLGIVWHVLQQSPCQETWISPHVVAPLEK